jgi:hypothetical protein
MIELKNIAKLVNGSEIVCGSWGDDSWRYGLRYDQ